MTNTLHLKSAPPVPPAAEPPRHTPPPTICGPCLGVLFTLAATSKADDRCLKVCTHAPDGLAVVACAQKAGADIATWLIQGPMPTEQATLVCTSMAAHLVQAGGVVRDKPKLQ